MAEDKTTTCPERATCLHLSCSREPPPSRATPELTATMRQMVGFRNIVVPGYHSVDPRIMRDIVEHRLDDLLVFTTAIKFRLEARTDQ